MKSGQLWKVIAGLALLLAGSAADLAISHIIAAAHSPAVAQWYNLQFLGVLVSAGGFIYLCMGTRCPRCGARWIWLGVTGKLNPKSLDTLITLDHCPVCSYSADPPH